MPSEAPVTIAQDERGPKARSLKETISRKHRGGFGSHKPTARRDESTYRQCRKYKEADQEAEEARDFADKVNETCYC